ncbi:hypothetical protein TNIN_350181 [Trichonephila inaurata madagascariensis]|uniref:Uncharacterized protein n=1 Tax=Trichonephila inaurata madagascariensis TaxID=2747483 RepID=A0A8X7C5Q9_9ARAC|nr:hypothetical protein TNIN_350181 [Trichonephila inaurata madagascariensis]
MRKKIGPGTMLVPRIFPGFRFLHKKTRVGLIWETPPHKGDCTKTRAQDPTCCHCRGKHPPNSRPSRGTRKTNLPPPPKVNFLGGKSQEEGDGEAPKGPSRPCSPKANKPPPAFKEVKISSPRPQVPFPAGDNFKPKPWSP